MKERPLLKWISGNAFGLGVGFLAALQTGMLVRYGFDFERHWQFVPPEYPAPPLAYASILVSLLFIGTVLGSAQALVLPSRSVRVARWILSTTAGFGLMVAVVWPLLAANLWGRFPGPVEPIIILVGGGSVAGVLQYLALRWQGIYASKWVLLWIAGLAASLLPTALFFMSLEGLRVSLGWPTDTFLSGFIVAGVASLISGKALFAVLLERPKQTDRPGYVSEGAV